MLWWRPITFYSGVRGVIELNEAIRESNKVKELRSATQAGNQAGMG
mgnify:CR=1 FL=1|jgi:hypothetical protein